jgi:hypothetical protein
MIKDREQGLNIWGEEDCNLPPRFPGDEELHRCTVCCFFYWKFMIDHLIETEERLLCEHAYPGEGCELKLDLDTKPQGRQRSFARVNPFPSDFSLEEKKRAREGVCGEFHCSDLELLQQFAPQMTIEGIKLMMMDIAVKNGDLTSEQAVEASNRMLDL